MRFVRAAVLTVALALATTAHVGNSSIVFQGEAGAYPVTVVIRPPEVVPGLAEISVRVEGEGVEQVTVLPTRWDAAPEDRTPRPDVASLVSGTTDLYSSELWLMTTGAYRVDVSVEGAAGGGVASVPVTSIATTVRDLPPGLGWVLVGLAVFLYFGAISIFGAAARESVLDASQTPDAKSRLRGRIAMGIGAVVVGLLAYGGKSWWDAIDAEARSGVFQRLQVEARTDVMDGTGVLEIAITDEQWLGRGYSPFVPDHGKLMHMFIVGSDMGAFAHVHPLPVDSASFRVAWPDLPPGEYRVYGDVVHETGFSQTVVDTVVVDAIVASATSARAGDGSAETPSPTTGSGSESVGTVPDPDDSAWTGTAAVETSRVFELADGARVTWAQAGPLSVDEPTNLAFEVTTADGANVALEPYMGMLSHAAVTRADGEVFVHLHPSGTISMGSLGVLEARAAGDPDFRQNITTGEGHRFMRPEAGPGAASRTAAASGSGAASATGIVSGTDDLMTDDAAMEHDMSGNDGAGQSRVEFPFAFPRPGDYTIWVQVKFGGRVETAAFSTTVSE